MSTPELTPTGMFNPKISFARGVYNRIGGQATDKTLTELATFGLPAILIPYPAAAGNHQLHNARVFKRAGRL